MAVPRIMSAPHRLFNGQERQSKDRGAAARITGGRDKGKGQGELRLEWEHHVATVPITGQITPPPKVGKADAARASLKGVPPRLYLAAGAAAIAVWCGYSRRGSTRSTTSG